MTKLSGVTPLSASIRGRNASNDRAVASPIKSKTCPTPPWWYRAHSRAHRCAARATSAAAATSPSHARVRVPRRASESFPRPRVPRESTRARERSSLPLVDARRDDVRRSIARVVVVFIIIVVIVFIVIVIIGRCLPEHEHETERNRTNERTNERDRRPTLPRAPSPSLSRSRAALSPSLSIRVETDARARGRRVTARAHPDSLSRVRVYVSYCTPNDTMYASITAERPSIRWYSITHGRLCVHTTYRVSVSVSTHRASLDVLSRADVEAGTTTCMHA